MARVPVPDDKILEANTAGAEGDRSFGRGDYYAALIKYLASTRANPNNARAYNGLGMAYSRLGYPSEAVSAFERAIALAPKYAPAHNNLGTMLLVSGKTRSAERCFRRAIALDPSTSSFHINLGAARLARGEPEEAMREFRKALVLDPGSFRRAGSRTSLDLPMRSPETHYRLARFFASLGDARQAVEKLSLAVQQGFSKVESIRDDRDFDPIRNDASFQSWLRTAAAAAGR